MIFDLARQLFFWASIHKYELPNRNDMIEISLELEGGLPFPCANNTLMLGLREQ